MNFVIGALYFVRFSILKPTLKVSSSRVDRTKFKVQSTKQVRRKQ